MHASHVCTRRQLHAEWHMRCGCSCAQGQLQFDTQPRLMLGDSVHNNGSSATIRNSHPAPGRNKKSSNDKTAAPVVTFKDIAGVDVACQELLEVVACLRHTDRYSALNAKVPSGVLLCGPPGTGKTLLGRCPLPDKKPSETKRWGHVCLRAMRHTDTARRSTHRCPAACCRAAHPAPATLLLGARHTEAARVLHRPGRAATLMCPEGLASVQCWWTNAGQGLSGPHLGHTHLGLHCMHSWPAWKFVLPGESMGRCLAPHQPSHHCVPWALTSSPARHS